MLVKERTIPLKILILSAILRRIPLSHARYQQISDELGRRQAGYEGEQSLDFYYRELPKLKYLIFHDLNLPDGDYNCQIDTLLLTPEFILIIDVKNMAGKLIFDTENEQFIQIKGEEEKGYSYPITQAERHQEYIKKLLAANHFPPVPVVYLVVISNSYASYVITGKNAYKVKPKVCKGDVMLKRIQDLEGIYTTPILTAKDLRKLSRLLLKMNTPPTGYLLQKFGIQRLELLTGVQCPYCKYLPMIRKKQKWFCAKCQHYSIDAHIGALKDYFLLIDMKITNREFREFMHIKSIDTAKRLLQASNLKFSGANKNRTYFPKTIPW
ncbi:nuclease-related domain-containing protein [Bacillus salipaludis]|uniref:Nuclease-related domain-containing protein n=1 Tax=Bacillus salipaludis TaxID=2547811 RepID=A0AA90R9W4_9BACI|nr:nuclease-related domain-containing protein [Bacillus salipaludis]MDQ6600141.1 nuclease-related domain-containing protein [Bacillus salipaludis]